MKLFLSILIVFSVSFIYTQALVSNIDSCLLVLKKSKNDTNKVILLQQIAGHYNIKDLEKAKKYAEESIELSKTLGYKFGEIISLNTLANYYERSDQFPKALAIYNDALAKAKAIKSDKALAIVHNNIGIIYTNTSKYDQAISNYLLAIKAEERIKNEIGVAQGYNNVGVVYFYMGKTDKTIEYISKSVAISQRIGNIHDALNGYINLAAISESQENFEEAIAFYEKALRTSKKIGDPKKIAQVLSNMAITFSKQKSFDKSNQYYEKAIAIQDSVKNYSSQAHALINYGSSLIQQKQLAKAEQKIKSGLALAEKLSYNLILQEGYSLMSDLHEKRGDFKQSNLFLRKYLAVHDSITNKESRNRISELEIEYQTEKKEKKLLEQKASLSQKELKLEQQNSLLIGSGSVILLLVFIAFFIYKLQRNKRMQLQKENDLKVALAKIETQNKLEDQRLRISRDLHDNIGSQLTFIISGMDNMLYQAQHQKQIPTHKIEQLNDFTRATITDLRDTIWAMNKDEISFLDLKQRLSSFIQKANLTSDTTKCLFQFDENTQVKTQFSSFVGINIYRIIQESVNNALKYAEATEVKIEVDVCSNSEFKFSVTDNGTGFKLEQIELGNGLENMKHRAKEIGSQLHLNTELGKGTRIDFTVKIETTNEAGRD